MARIALKVDVDTLRGTLEGVPRLLELFGRLDIAATFLFSLGPDHTGWALRRVFRPGFASKVARTSVLRHYGLRTLMYGTLLPAPDIGRRAASAMRQVRDAGHECGIHTWDHVLWQDNVRRRDSTWTLRQMNLAYERFQEVFATPPATHGAAGWQMNDAALHQIDRWTLPFASDCRGVEPFFPRVGGVALTHVQLPTTLPTYDELLGLDGMSAADVAERLIERTDGDGDHVYTLHAELEGGLLAGAFESLLWAWTNAGHRLGTLGDLYRTLDLSTLPVADVSWGSVPGRSGELMVAA